MPAVEPHNEAKPLDLLIDWEKGWNRPTPWRSAVGSVAAHVAIVFAALALPARDYTEPDFPRRAEIDIRSKAVTLVVPRDLLTQKAQNRNKPADQLDLAGLMSRPEAKPVAPKVKAPPPAPKAFNAPPTPAPAKRAETDPAPPDPKAVAQNLPPALGAGASVPTPVIAPPPVPAPEKPKLAFETPGSASGTPKGQIQAPAQMSVADAAKAAARSGAHAGGAVVIGDLSGDPTPGIPPLPGTQGKSGNSLELLSDPMGADFKPYLIRVLAAVRRNWFAVMPESARMGMRGRTTIQFTISQNGSVPKLVIHFPSGSEHLDRAAVAGISASNPFPPLPADFRGSQIRLQLVFAYNMPR